MLISEIIKEVKAIESDFLASKLVFDEVLIQLETLSKNTGVDISNLYNAFYSSEPEQYIN